MVSEPEIELPDGRARCASWQLPFDNGSGFCHLVNSSRMPCLLDVLAMADREWSAMRQDLSRVFYVADASQSFPHFTGSTSVHITTAPGAAGVMEFGMLGHDVVELRKGVSNGLIERRMGASGAVCHGVRSCVDGSVDPFARSLLHSGAFSSEGWLVHRAEVSDQASATCIDWVSRVREFHFVRRGVKMSMAFVGGSWGVSCTLLAVNSVMSLIAAAIAGWAFNQNMNQALDHVVYGANVQGRVVASFFLPLALVASVVSIGSILAGVYHLRVWRTDSLAAAVSVALIAWLLSILSAGVALKEIHIGGARSSKLKVVEAFMVLLPLFEFYYLLSLHAAVLLNGKQGDTPLTTASQETQTLSEKIDIVVEDRLDHADSD